MIKSTKSKQLLAARVSLTENVTELEMRAQILSAKIRRVLRTAELLDKKANSIVESAVGERAFNSYLDTLLRVNNFMGWACGQIDETLNAVFQAQQKALSKAVPDSEPAEESDDASEGGLGE